MNITIIQPDIRWEDKAFNLARYEKLISATAKTDVIILPEMFTTGFTSRSEELSEPPRGETFNWMIHAAEKYDTAVCGSYIVRTGNHLFNRFMFVSPAKKAWHYDKRHLFKMNNVENNFSRGGIRVILKFRGLRICPNICYDLRFPVWSRNRNDYDLLINCANWPAARREVWMTLLKARAIENLCFVAGVNRIGTDGMNVKYSGDSLIIDPKGSTIASAGKNTENTISAYLSLADLNSFRKKFPAHLDADDFTIGL
ncbi:MAG TPA: amidohydrolase [Bacteroidales bacterium]|nr:amidohydrolase [Bacteroidales bacterium]HPF04192.1 amidohydrolase [Bacteroidales bacterium]HPJ59514.1 amidohydrolase [Bacteroidales bacterium]HPR12051.1 amidohydrolase [Bacteroidales bacterium]HRW85927.1 amidohydrolase [Bacteroidales bacterium]